jgi:hypothetical protein
MPRSVAAIHVSSATTAVASSQGQSQVCVSNCTYRRTAEQSFPETSLHATTRKSSNVLNSTTQEVAQFAIRSKRHRHKYVSPPRPQYAPHSLLSGPRFYFRSCPPNLQPATHGSSSAASTNTPSRREMTDACAFRKPFP